MFHVKHERFASSEGTPLSWLAMTTAGQKFDAMTVPSVPTPTR